MERTYTEDELQALLEGGVQKLETPDGRMFLLCPRVWHQGKMHKVCLQLELDDGNLGEPTRTVTVDDNVSPDLDLNFMRMVPVLGPIPADTADDKNQHKQMERTTARAMAMEAKEHDCKRRWHLVNDAMIAATNLARATTQASNPGDPEQDVLTVEVVVNLRTGDVGMSAVTHIDKDLHPDADTNWLTAGPPERTREG